MTKIGCLTNNEESAEMIRATLANANIECEILQDQNTFIRKIEQGHDYDLVLLEHNPPDQDALKVQATLCQTAPSLRVMIVSNDRSLETVMTAIKGGAVAYLRTPIESTMLVDQINVALTKVPTRITSVTADALQGVMSRPTNNGYHAALIEAHQDSKSQGWLVKFDVDSPDGTASEVVVDLPYYTVELAKALSDCEHVPGNERFWVAMAEEALASTLSSGKKIPDNGKLIVDQIDSDLKRWLDAVLTVR